jgi:transposase
MSTSPTVAEQEARRRLAVELLSHGKTKSEVAEWLSVSLSSVKRWKKAFDVGGVAALNTKRHPGPKFRLDAKQKQKLVKLLLRGAKKAGFSTDLWTCPRVAQVIEEQFGVHYHVDHVWHFLSKLGWSCQKPETRSRESDDAAIERWRKRDWPRIKKEPLPQS